MLAVSGGDNFSAKDDREWQRQSYFLWEMMGEAGWDLSAVQSTDLLMGVDALRAEGERQGIELLGANILDGKGRPIFAGSRIYEFEGRRLGVLAVYVPEDQAARGRLGDDLRFGDPRRALLEGVGRLDAECDAVLVLLGGRRRSAIELCDDVEGIDLILYGVSTSSQRVPAETRSGAPIYTAASRGKDFGHITLTFEDDGRLRLSPFTVHELTLEMPEDPYIAERVAEYLRRAGQREERARELRRRVAHLAEMEVDEGYTGADLCKRCHGDIWESAADTGHWKSYESLVKRFEEDNPDCIGCHVTGWMRPGGYGQSVTDTRDLARVQCEACHGHGSAHARDGSMLEAAREACVRCHNDAVPDDCGAAPGSFDYEAAWKRIAH